MSLLWKSRKSSMGLMNRRSETDSFWLYENWDWSWSCLSWELLLQQICIKLILAEFFLIVFFLRQYRLWSLTLVLILRGTSSDNKIQKKRGRVLWSRWSRWRSIWIRGLRNFTKFLGKMLETRRFGEREWELDSMICWAYFSLSK